MPTMFVLCPIGLRITLGRFPSGANEEIDEGESH